MLSDGLTQQLADLAERIRIEHSSDFKDHSRTTWKCRCGWSTADRHAPVALFKRHVAEALAQATLASELVVPTSAILNRAKQWERMGPALTDGISVATELRTLTRQENP